MQTRPATSAVEAFMSGAGLDRPLSAEASSVSQIIPSFSH